LFCEWGVGENLGMRRWRRIERGKRKKSVSKIERAK
jgi:hypothetical protein